MKNITVYGSRIIFTFSHFSKKNFDDEKWNLNGASSTFVVCTHLQCVRCQKLTKKFVLYIFKNYIEQLYQRSSAKIKILNESKKTSLFLVTWTKVESRMKWSSISTHRFVRVFWVCTPIPCIVLCKLVLYPWGKIHFFQIWKSWKTI